VAYPIREYGGTHGDEDDGGDDIHFANGGGPPDASDTKTDLHPSDLTV
jgi:hypothetical protein